MDGVKALLIPFMLLLFVSGCSLGVTEGEEEKIEFEIVDAVTAIGKVGNDQRLSYEFIIANKGEAAVKEDSIEMVLSDWLKKRLLEETIVEKNFEQDRIVVKGFIMFKSNDLPTPDVIQNEPLIKGIKFLTAKGTEVFVPYHSSKGVEER